MGIVCVVSVLCVVCTVYVLLKTVTEFPNISLVSVVGMGLLAWILVLLVVRVFNTITL